MGAWIETNTKLRHYCPDVVAPHVGAWIETVELSEELTIAQSLPMWERGLKLDKVADGVCRYESLPMWERGLKFMVQIYIRYHRCDS